MRAFAAVARRDGAFADAFVTARRGGDARLTVDRLPDGRVLRVAYLAGNRMDDDLRAVGAALTTHCDRLWVSDPDPRGREEGATSALIAEGARAAGLEAVSTTISEWDSFEACFAEAQPGDLLTFQCEDHKGLIERIRQMQASLMEVTA